MERNKNFIITSYSNLFLILIFLIKIQLRFFSFNKLNKKFQSQNLIFYLLVLYLDKIILKIIY